MNILSAIKKSGAMLMVFIYLFSIVPKSYLHSVLADHQDFETSCNHKAHNSACVKTAGINCHINDLVVNLPFIEQEELHLSKIDISFYCFDTPDVKAAPTPYSYSKESRGPPALL